jgi:hypothetical protein
MTLKSRLARIEAESPGTDTIHLMGWKGCEWKYAEELVRGETESKNDFFERVCSVAKKSGFGLINLNSYC